MNAPLSHAVSAILNSVDPDALLAFARAVVAHEQAQAEMHFQNYRYGDEAICPCEDCTNKPRYPATFGKIARDLLAAEQVVVQRSVIPDPVMIDALAAVDAAQVAEVAI